MDRDYLIVLGRVDSVLQISKINYDDYAKEKRKKQTNNTPPFVSTVNISYPGEKELVNEKEVELICEKANVVINESKQGLFEKVFA